MPKKLINVTLSPQKKQDLHDFAKSIDKSAASLIRLGMGSAVKHGINDFLLVPLIIVPIEKSTTGHRNPIFPVSVDVEIRDSFTKQCSYHGHTATWMINRIIDVMLANQSIDVFKK